MRKVKFGLGHQITTGFALIIMLFSVVAGVVFYQSRQNTATVSRTFEVMTPSVAALSHLEQLVISAKALSTAWVFMPKNEADKEALRRLHQVLYLSKRAELRALMEHWEDPAEQAAADSLLVAFETLIGHQAAMMDQLATFDDYQSLNRLMAEEILENDIMPGSNALLEGIEALSVNQRARLDTNKQALIDSFGGQGRLIVIIGLLMALGGVVVATLTTRQIVRPVQKLHALIRQLSAGELPEKAALSSRKDEIGEMSCAVDGLIDGLRQTSRFAKSIGQGELEASFTPLSERDVLGTALLDMRQSLQQVAKADEQRQWATEGVATFGELFRAQYENTQALSDAVITKLVKYLGANQGGLFVVQSSEDETAHLELMGCYAWNRKKYLRQTWEKGEGLAGQAWRSGDTILLTEVPEDYIRITSGLGKALPRCVLVVPLKMNDEIFGVIELASFEVFAPHQVEFVSKIGETLANTLSTVQVSQRTAQLLEESQMLTEQMRAQEEEMRQNMEELAATQEETQRNQQEFMRRDAALNAGHAVLELNNDFQVTAHNPLSEELLPKSPTGCHLTDLLAGTEPLLTAVREGNTWAGSLTPPGSDVPLHAFVSPLEGGNYLLTLTAALAVPV